MEFRIFLPILPPQGHGETCQKVDLYNRLVSSIRNHPKIDPLRGLFSSVERRSDLYVVSQPQVGIKLRGGKKLELKLLNATHGPLMIEEYTKEKVKSDHWKKKLKNLLSAREESRCDLSTLRAKQLKFVTEMGEEIMGRILDSGIPCNMTDLRLTRPQMLNIVKSRCQQYIPDKEIVMEICDIHIDDDMPGEAKQNDWLSVAFEGSIDSIHATLLSDTGAGAGTGSGTGAPATPSIPPTSTSPMGSNNDNLSTILGSIVEALQVCESLARDSTAEPSFLPIIAGYPTWIRAAAGVMTSEEREACLMQANQILQCLLSG